METNKITGILKMNSSSNPQAPLLKGFTKIDGKMYWISAWWNQNGTGKPGKLENEPHYQLIFQEAEPQQQSHIGGTSFNQRPPHLGIPAHDPRGAKLSAPIGRLSNLDDDIPF